MCRVCVVFVNLLFCIFVPQEKKTVCDNNCSLKPNLKHLRCCYSQPCLNQFRRLEGWVCDPFDDETRNTHWFNLISRRLRYMGVILSENKWVNICTVGYEFKISPHFLMPSFISSAYLCCLRFSTGGLWPLGGPVKYCKPSQIFLDKTIFSLKNRNVWICVVKIPSC